MTSRNLWRLSDEYEEDTIRTLPWYPGNIAWHVNFSRKQLRKSQSLESFHEFLKHESEVGTITRQEAVSMVPPLFLNVQPDHHILDMCAAPGSKTIQLLETIHKSIEPGLLPRAVVIANDANVQRCDLLIHHTKRMCTANLIVTHHEAQNFPGYSLAKACTETCEDNSTPQWLEFDRILCDVPCSGDGTVRKAHDMWRKWNSGMGNELHRVQVDIAMRGVALLKVGGRMVYSTCSMNPVENEAVVAELLRRSGDSLELLDVSSQLPELVRRPGLTTCKVRDIGSWFCTHKNVPHYRKNVILPSMFPPDNVGDENEKMVAGEDNNDSLSRNSNSEHTSKFDCGMDEVSRSGPAKSLDSTSISMNFSSFPLHRCMRIVPHDQNSGAFFIAVLQKLSPLNEGQVVEVTKTEHTHSTAGTEKLQKELESATMPSGEISMHQQRSVSEVDDTKVLVGQQNIDTNTQTSKGMNLEDVKVASDDVENSQVGT